MLCTKCVLTAVFIWHWRWILTNLKMWNPPSYILCRLPFPPLCNCLYFCSGMSSTMWSFHSLSLTQTRPRRCFFSCSHFERVFILPSFCWKTAGRSNKSVNFRNLLNSFRALHPLQFREDADNWQHICLLQSILYAHVKGFLLSRGR